MIWQNLFYRVVCVQLIVEIKLKKILFLVVVQEEGARKVFVYLNIPELKVKRSFPNLLKFMPSNGHEKVVDFQNQ